MSGYEEAQSFQATHDFVATRAQFWAEYLGNDPPANNYGVRGVFDWAIYADASGTPGVAVASGSADPERVDRNPGGAVDSVAGPWTIDLPDVALAGNTTYWFGLHNTDGTGSFVPAQFFWEAAYVYPPGTLASQHRGADGQWVQNPAIDEASVGYGNRLTLGIYGDPITTTPEPASIGLLGLGFVGLAPTVRRRFRKGWRV